MLEIAIPLFDRVTSLDAIGPYDVLSRLPDARVRFHGLEPGVVRTDNGMLGLAVDEPLEALPHPDVLVVPGGNGTRALLHDERMLGWLREAYGTSRWTASASWCSMSG